MTLVDAGYRPEPILTTGFRSRLEWLSRILSFPGGGIGLYLSMLWIAAIILVSLFVQWLPLPSYVKLIGLPNTWSTDSVGRSLLSRLCYGARISILISFVSTAIALSVGSALGLLAIYVHGLLEEAIDTVMNAILSVPTLLLLLAIVLALRPSIPVLIGALSLTFVPGFMRITRSNGQSQMGREYVLVARGFGTGGTRLMLREVLPNAFPPVFSYAVLVLPAIIVAEGSLSFLGFGVQAPTPSWGAMIAESQPTLTAHPWQGLLPCLILFLTVFSMNTVGDALRQRVTR